MIRAAEPKENPFQTIFCQDETKVLINARGKIAEALADRGRYVLAHVRVSI